MTKDRHVAKNEITNRLDRAAVVDAACRVADRDGFYNVSLTTLAAELDRHASSLYNHVEGLDGLRRDVTVVSLEQLCDRLWRAVLGRGGAEGVRALADAYRSFAAEFPGRFDAATTWQDRFDRDDESMVRVRDQVTDALHAVMASFGLPDDAVAHASRVFTSAVTGFSRSAGRSFGGPPPADETFDALVDLFVIALSGSEWLR